MSHRAPPATQPAALEVLEARRLVAEMFFTLPHAAGTVTSPLVGTASLEVSLQPAGEEPADDEADAAFASMDLFPHVDSRASLFASQGQRRLGSAAVGTRALPQPLPSAEAWSGVVSAAPLFGRGHDDFQVASRGFGLGPNGERLTEIDPMLGWGRDRERGGDMFDPNGRTSVGNPPVAPEDPIHLLDLKVDANRDGVLSESDDAIENQAGLGTDTGGALVLPNSDRDGTSGVPDNWRAGRWPHPSNSSIVPANTTIDANGDLGDLATLAFRPMRLYAAHDVQPVARLVLSVSSIPGEHSYFSTNFSAQNRVRIFLPSGTDPNTGAAIPAVGDAAVIGPEAGATRTFTAGSGLELFTSPRRQVNLAVEGIVPGAGVRITMSAYAANDALLGADTVRMRVAPFVFDDHRRPIDLTLGGGSTPLQDSVIVVNAGSSNSDLRTKLSSGFGTQLQQASISDVWIQDGIETGYAQAPYGFMPLILELPRGRARGGVIANHVRTTFAGKDVGIDTTIQGSPTTFDSGGNLDSLPHPDGGPGYFFHGRAQSSFQTQFIAAQGVNPLLSVNTDWLYVGHVDEIVSLLPAGDRAVVADPELAWAMVQWAARVNPAATMMSGMADAPTNVGALAANTALWNYNRTYSLQSDRLPAIIGSVGQVLGATLPESTPVAASGNVGNGMLSEGGAFVAFFGDGLAREYEMTFIDSTTYNVRWRHAGGNWSASVVGSCLVDEVFPGAGAYLLKHWWTGTPQANDRFTFTADPGARLIEVPLLFAGSGGTTGFSHAYTTNHVNLLSAADSSGGTTAYVGYSHGPLGSYLPGQPANANLFDDYVSAALHMGGYESVVFADSRMYHNGIGNIHCGTNDLRVGPETPWWQFPRA